METAVNLKRRDRGEGHAKKLCPNTPLHQSSYKGKTHPSPKKPPIKNDLINTPGKDNPPDKNIPKINPNKTPLKNSSSSKNPTPNKPTPLKARVYPFVPSHPPLSLLLNSPYTKGHNPRLELSLKTMKAGDEPNRSRRRKTKNRKNLFQTAVDLSSIKLEAIADFQLRKKLKPLIDLEMIDNKLIRNPFNFRGAPMVTTFVRSVSCRTRGVWDFLNQANQTDAGIRLAELEHPSVKKMLTFCAGRVPIYFHPSFYRALKIRYPMDVGGVSRDGRVSTDLGTGSLRQAIGILAPNDFRAIVDT